MLYNGQSNICPICGGKIIHSYTGNVTSKQLDDEYKLVKEFISRLKGLKDGK